MTKYSLSFLMAFILLLIFGCKKEGTGTYGVTINDVTLKVSFQENKSASIPKATTVLTKETPTSYYIGLKSVKLIGNNGTSNAELFNKPNLSSSMVFDFNNSTASHSLLNGTTVPKGNYSAIEFEVYFLQMNIAIATTSRGTERRNIRIYLSDDAETEGGMHQPGDLTQINNSQEIGWLMGKNAFPNFDPGAPRIAEYSADGNGVNWLNFAGKSAKDFGPFGNVEFFSTAPHPIYKAKAAFVLKEGKGTQLIVDFNVNGCWQYEDRSGDGIFGPQDLPNAWAMNLPVISITQN